MTVSSDTDARCANCGADLTGPFCARCGQSARDLYQPLRTLLVDALDEVFNLDARLVRTVRPLLFSPGRVTKEYLAGRRVEHLPPLRTYLITALLFFGLFSLFPPQSPPVYVVTAGSVEAEQVRGTSARGSRVTIELPEHTWIGSDARYQEVSARARANPQAFASAAYRNIPRAFFVFLPIFALLLSLFYWRRYYIEHLVFALYYQAFVFLALAIGFLLGWLPNLLARSLRWALVPWLIVYLLIALRRVSGDSWAKTACKGILLIPLYVIGFFIFGFGFITLMAILTF